MSENIISATDASTSKGGASTGCGVEVSGAGATQAAKFVDSVKSKVAELIPKGVGIKLKINEMFPGPKEGAKVPETPKALKVKCQLETKIKLPDFGKLPGITLPTIPDIDLSLPDLPDLPEIPRTLTLGPCTVELDDCVSLPSFAGKLDSLKETLAGYIPPVVETTIIEGLETIGDVKDKIAATQGQLNDLIGGINDIISNLPTELPVDVSLGLDAIPCPDKIKRAAKKAEEAAKKAEEEAEKYKGSRKERNDSYSKAIKDVAANYKKHGINTEVMYSKLRPTDAIKVKVIEEDCHNVATIADLKDKLGAQGYQSLLCEINKPLNDWSLKYKGEEIKVCSQTTTKTK